MRTIWWWTCTICTAFLLSLSASYAADNWGKFELQKGDEFEYERTNSKGKKSTQIKIYEGTDAAANHIFDLSNGGKETRTPFGAWVSNSKYKTKTHSGVSSKTMEIGKTWRHRYDIYNSWNSFEYTRVRKCAVIAVDTISVPAGEFETVHVRCTSQREDRASGRDENWWFDTRTGQIVLGQVEWVSDGLSYSSSRRLVRIKTAGR